MKRNNNWFNGAEFRVPSTNNALEGFNGRLKKYHTFWKQRGLNEFKVESLNIVKSISKEYVNRKNGFKAVVTISHKAKQDGMKMSKYMSVLPKKNDMGGAICYMRSGDSPEDLNEEQVNELMLRSKIPRLIISSRICSTYI